jgi:alpha-tubulin suppressor-like RCC1 family protein
MKLLSLLIALLVMSCGDETTKKQNPTAMADVGSDIGDDMGTDASENNGGNRAPTFLNLPATESISRGESGAFDLEASDPDGDALSFGLVDTDCSFEVQVIATSGRATWLCPQQTLSCIANMSVKDDAGLVGEGVLSIECVRPEPVISSVPPTEATEATPLVYQVECSDPEGAAVTIMKGLEDTCNGIIQGNAYRWTPSTNQADQSCILSVECSNQETSATQSSEVNVLGINKAPSASDVRISPSAPTQPGEPLTCLYTFDDPDGDADQSTIEWLVNGAVSGSGATFSDYDAGESVRCRVTPYDGDLSGPNQTSGPLVFEWEVLIRASNEYTCVRTRLGGVRCWGHNRSGVIGSSTTGFRSVHLPTTPPGLTSNVSQLTTGYDFACAVQADDLKCWGAGAIAKQNTHIPTTILSGGVTSMSGGLGHVCVVQNGAAKCWGSNYAGQLGLGFSDFANVDDPTTVPGLESGVTKIVAGEMSTCAVQNGALKCWGSNLEGECGVPTNFGTFDDLTSPVQVQGLGANTTDLWGQIAHICAVHNGTLKCFGNNGWGQLGRGTTTDEWSAAAATAVPASFTELELGRNNTCFLASGTLRCFGRSDGIMLGFAGAVSLLPVTVLTSVDSFSLGPVHACAERTGVISCWGSNNYGQLGNGVGTGNDTPQGLTQVTY